MRESIRRLTTLFLAAVLAAGCMTAPAAAAGSPAISSNINRQDYTTYGSTVKSYLYENGQGGLTRVEYTGGQVVVEEYDSGFRYLSGRTISPELPLWGGFFAGSGANYLIFGQRNPNEDDGAEVIRVVKYSKDWDRLGSASLKGANTTVPFGKISRIGRWPSMTRSGVIPSEIKPILLQSSSAKLRYFMGSFR